MTVQKNTVEEYGTYTVGTTNAPVNVRTEAGLDKEKIVLLDAGNTVYLTAFFYLDPPYLGTEKIYDVSFSRDDHVKLKQLLNGIKGLFLPSYNDDPIIRDLYKDFNVEAIDRSNNMSSGRYKELLIRNY